MSGVLALVLSQRLTRCKVLELDASAVVGAVSLPVNPSSTAYTDVNTLLEEHARRRASKIFIESPDQGSRVTFGEFEALTRRFANFLAAEGVTLGDRVSVLSENTIEALVIFWGALRAGVIVNPVNVEIREKQVGHILHGVAPSPVFCPRHPSSDLPPLVPAGTTLIPFGTWNAGSPGAD